MIFRETEIGGAFEVELEEVADERGFFARAYCAREFERQGLSLGVVQTSMSFSKRAGTLRGMHYQVAPHREMKLVRCVRGAIYDVIVDLRRDSPSFKRWIGVNLTAGNRKALVIPEGCAHGFETLEDNSEVLYQVSEFYDPSSERGLRHDDPSIGIQWPLAIALISEKDRHWPDWDADQDTRPPKRKKP